MPWQFFIAFYFLFAVSRELLMRWYVQRSKLAPQVIGAVSFILGILPFGLVIGFASDTRAFNWSAANLLTLAVVGTFIALFTSFRYAATRRINITLSMTLHQIYVLVAAVLGWVLLGNSLSPQRIFGGILLLSGAYLAIFSIRRNSKNGTSAPLQGVIFALLGGLCLGVALVAEKRALDNMNMAAYFIVGWGVQTLGTVLLALPKAKTVKRESFSRFELLGATACGLLMALGGFSYINALTRLDNVGLAALLTTFNLPLSAIASHFVLGERDNSKLLLAGATVSFIGLLVTAL